MWRSRRGPARRGELALLLPYVVNRWTLGALYVVAVILIAWEG